MLSDKIKQNRAESVKGKKVFYPSIWHENKAGNIGIHPYACALRASASYNYLVVNGVRRPTIREMLRLQGFPEDFKPVGSNGALRKLIGNSVPVPMIQKVAENMLRSLESGKTATLLKQVKIFEVS